MMSAPIARAKWHLLSRLRLPSHQISSIESAVGIHHATLLVVGACSGFVIPLSPPHLKDTRKTISTVSIEMGR